MDKGYVKLEIDDKVYKIPTSFDTLSFETYCKIFYNLPTLKDDMEDAEKFKMMKENESIILSRVLGEKDNFCLDLPITVYNKLINIIKYIFDVSEFEKNSKANIVIDGKHYGIPPVSEMALRRFIDADVVLNEQQNNMQYIEMLAILLSTKDKDGKWTPYNGKYEDMMGKLRSMPCSKVLPLVYHFFKKGEALQKLSKAYMKMEGVNQLLQPIQDS